MFAIKVAKGGASKYGSSAAAGAAAPGSCVRSWAVPGGVSALTAHGGASGGAVVLTENHELILLPTNGGSGGSSAGDVTDTEDHYRRLPSAATHQHRNETAPKLAVAPQTPSNKRSRGMSDLDANDAGRSAAAAAVDLSDLPSSALPPVAGAFFRAFVRSRLGGKE